MRKAGALIALIAGILSALATLATPHLPVTDTIGGIFIAAVVIVLASLILHTRRAWYSAALVLMAAAGLYQALGGGLVMAFTALALVGGILSGFESEPVPADLL